MRIGTMIQDISTAMVRKPYTRRYPFERAEPPQRLRGQLRWDAASCTGCGICGMDCPSGALEVIVLDKKEKRFILKYQLDACTFCAQCVFSCRQGSLQMSSGDWELAALNREGFQILMGDANEIKRWQESLSLEPAG